MFSVIWLPGRLLSRETQGTGLPAGPVTQAGTDAVAIQRMRLSTPVNAACAAGRFALMYDAPLTSRL